MWLMLNDCFLSIVSKDCPRDSLLVRARRQGDIEKIFPNAGVERTDKADYLFRAVVKRDVIAAAMQIEVQRVAYVNFKDSVADKALHDAYLRVWEAMARLQPPHHFGAEDEIFVEPYHGPVPMGPLFLGPHKKQRRRAKRRGKK